MPAIQGFVRPHLQDKVLMNSPKRVLEICPFELCIHMSKNSAYLIGIRRLDVMQSKWHLQLLGYLSAISSRWNSEAIMADHLSFSSFSFLRLLFFEMAFEST